MLLKNSAALPATSFSEKMTRLEALQAIVRTPIGIFSLSDSSVCPIQGVFQQHLPVVRQAPTFTFASSTLPVDYSLDECAEKMKFSGFGLLRQAKTAPWGDEHNSPKEKNEPSSAWGIGGTVRYTEIPCLEFALRPLRPVFCTSAARAHSSLIGCMPAITAAP
jgi:hypothetical protein